MPDTQRGHLNTLNYFDLRNAQAALSYIKRDEEATDTQLGRLTPCHRMTLALAKIGHAVGDQ